jgi:hypothetical protein
MTDIGLEDWVRERLDNCQRIAAQKVGHYREGWLEDAQYFQRILAAVVALREISESDGDGATYTAKKALGFAAQRNSDGGK